MRQLDAVTGAYGFTGRVIARQLLDRGRRVVTLTNRVAPSASLASLVPARSIDFGRPDLICSSLRDVDTLYATHWVRFDRGAVSFDRAVVENAVLFEAARQAGVRRIVHVSVTGADARSSLPYFRGKGRVEDALGASGVPHAIVRPALVFGPGDILVNNIAYLLRRLPVFGIPGDGRYRVQPVHVDDLAALCIRAAAGETPMTIDAVGPEVMSYRHLVASIGAAVGSRARLVNLPVPVVATTALVIGRLVRDITLTRDEIVGLMAGLLVSDGAATCPTRFGDWVDVEGPGLGRRYASELARHYVEPGDVPGALAGVVGE